METREGPESGAKNYFSNYVAMSQRLSYPGEDDGMTGDWVGESPSTSLCL